MDLDRQHKKDGSSGIWGCFDIKAAKQRNREFLKLKGPSAEPTRKDLELPLQRSGVLAGAPVIGCTSSTFSSLSVGLRLIQVSDAHPTAEA